MKNSILHFSISLKVLFLGLIFMLSANFAQAKAFITTWVTTDNQIIIPTGYYGVYNYDITWENLTNAGVGNGSITGRTGNYTITGLANGDTYRVSITGTFPQFFMNINPTERTKLRTIEQWGSIAWTSMESSFWGCSNLTYKAKDIPNLTGVTSLRGMFGSCTIFDGNATMNNWKTENIKSMAFMFSQASYFNQNISNWNTGNVTDMTGMFGGASYFNQNIGSWDTQNVRSMIGMFSDAHSFNQPIGTWNTENVKDMTIMFSDAHSFNQPIGTWNTENVIDMSNMFRLALSFNQPIGTWNTRNVRSFSQMFVSAIAFNQNIGSWNTQNVRCMSGMFAVNCNEIMTFNQDISKWNTSNVTNMAHMFRDNIAFNQNLGSWDLSSVDSVQNQSLQEMLSSCGMSTANYDATLIGWAANPKTPKNVILGSSGLSYCAALNDRNTILVGEKKWKITSDFPLSNNFLTYHFDGINLSVDVPVGTNFFNATWTIDDENEPSLNGLLSFKPPKNGVYELTLIGYSGCQIKMKTTVILAILSTDGENTLTLAVYPNPTTDRLFVSFGATPKTSVSAVMTDNLGRKMLDIEENVIDDKLEISTERLPTGIYFLTIRFDGTEKTIKIVKE